MSPICNLLHMSKKCSTFALDFETQTQKLYDYETD
jgi:hypothetical protein